ncbi:hypothetical protein HDU83_009255 [Entophlyctis luteolus]|nr:hypothetical protein HDU82_005248 [Entophlyctis luteolus]KAJ3351064.1 hypothetical protein HDU83_009255 [Entophlyctis luteolus]KAJ3390580.1 hypothetical protein HDU84_007281 [Entophlyctis sp. JEL0112]
MTSSLNTKASVQNIREAASLAAERLKPLGSSAVQRFSMVSQYAKEKMNAASADVTELPPKYRELEERVDRIKAQHEAFLKLTGNYSRKHYDYVPVFSETAKDVVSTVSAGWTHLITGSTSPTSPSSDVPPSLSHAYAKAARASIVPGEETEPMGAALSAFAKAQEAVGEARLQMDAEIINRVHEPTATTLNQTIAHAIRARRTVTNARLTYDAARSKMKTVKAGSGHEEAARIEMESAEDAFVAAVDDAMGKMTLVVESSEPLKNLADLVAAQAKYFKEANAIFSALLPEIDELQVTNEALKRSA